MTKRELMLLALVKITNQPEAHLKNVMKYMKFPAGIDWEEEVLDPQRAEFEAITEKEAKGILILYIRALRDHEHLRQDNIDTVAQANAARFDRSRKDRSRPHARRG